MTTKQHPFFPALPPSHPSQYILHNNNRQNIFEKTHQKLEGTNYPVHSEDCQLPVQSASRPIFADTRPMRASHDFAIHGCRQIFNFSHICLVIVELLQKMWMSIRSGFITVLLEPPLLPPAKEREPGECPVSFGVTFTQSLLLGPLVTNIQFFCLKIVVLYIS